MVLIDPFLITNETKHRLICLLMILISSSLQYLPKSLTQLSIQLVFFVLTSKSSLCILGSYSLLITFITHGVFQWWLDFPLCLGFFLRIEVLNFNVVEFTKLFPHS